MKRQKTEAIVIHCTATLAHQDFHKAEIDAMHKRRGWKSIGYHYLIPLDGKIETGRALDAQGAHVQGFNNRTIAIAYVGGLRSSDAKPVDTRKVPQINAMLDLCKTLSAKYPGAVILGHRDLSPDLDKDGTVEPQEWMKMCPCFDAGPWAAVNGLRGGYYSRGAFYRIANRPKEAPEPPPPVLAPLPAPAPETPPSPPPKPVALPPRAQTWREWLESFFN